MICVDASLAAKWIFPEEYSEQALALATASIQSAGRMIAPPLMPIEITNVIRKRMLRDRLTLREAMRLLNQFSRLSITIVAPAALSVRALTLANDHNLPAVYDAYYIALAQLLGCDLWTGDQRLLRALGNRLPFVKWVGDYPGEKP